MLRHVLPTSLYRLYERRIVAPRMMKRFGLSHPKHARELAYWADRYRLEGGQFKNDW